MLALEAYGITPDAVLPAFAEAAQFAVPLRLATAAYHSDTADIPASTAWPPRIVGPVELSQDVVSALGIGGAVALTAAEIVVHDGDGWAADLARYSTADGRAAEIRVVPVVNARASDFGTPLRNTIMAWRGTTRRVERLTGRRARISLDDQTGRLSALLQPNRYTGGGGLTGPVGLADRPLPVCIGTAFNVTPVDLGLINLGDGLMPTYQTHWRAIRGHTAARIRGVDQVKVLVAPTLAQWRDWPALGIFQLGSTPDGAVTCDVQGDADGAPETIPAVLWHMMTVLGPQYVEADRDSVSWQFAEADLPGAIGFYQPAQNVTAMEAVTRVLVSCGAVLAGDRAGALRLFDPFATSDVLQFDIDASGVVAEPEPVTLPDALSPAPREVRVEWGLNYTPLSDVGTAASAALRQRLGDAAAPSASYESAVVTQRVAAQRTLRFPGLYTNETDAAARALVIGEWLEGGARAVRFTIDRYLDVLNLGDYGRVTYPGYGLETGLSGVVVGMSYAPDRRRIAVTLVGTGG